MSYNRYTIMNEALRHMMGADVGTGDYAKFHDPKALTMKEVRYQGRRLFVWEKDSWFQDLLAQIRKWT